MKLLGKIGIILYISLVVYGFFFSTTGLVKDINLFIYGIINIIILLITVTKYYYDKNQQIDWSNYKSRVYPKSILHCFNCNKIKFMVDCKCPDCGCPRSYYMEYPHKVYIEWKQKQND